MLQSSNHYLRPDYLAAPNALDTKSSPLALLAQTCSAIGADTTNPKLLAANIEKSTKSHKSSGDGREKTSPLSSNSSSVSTGSAEQQQIKSCFKPYESNNNHIRDRIDLETEHATNLSQNQSQNQNQSQSQNQNQSQRVKTPKQTSAQQQQHQQHQHSHHHHQQMSQHQQQQQQHVLQRCDSNQSATSQRDSSPAVVTPNTNGLRNSSSSASTGSGTHIIDLHQHNSPSAKESPVGATASPAGTAVTPTSRLQANSEAAFAAAAAAAKEASYVKALQAAAVAAGVPTTSASPSSYYSSYPGATAASMGYPMDLMTASALMSPHHPMFKAAALNPYLNYARLKGLDPATAAAMLSPNVCRDPYCTGCPSSPHFLNKAAGQPCPSGCPQCEVAAGKSAAGSNSAAAAAAVAASSYHAQLAALAAASQLPYVCSWIGADTAYCGKRFGTSDELFQHLRTHTASLPDSVLSAAAAGGIPPNHPLFQRTYPTPPLSPLSAARYHPYGKPTMLPPSLGPPGSLAGLPMPPHPALAQYFSPYSIYGPRMGSSHP